MMCNFTCFLLPDYSVFLLFVLGSLLCSFPVCLFNTLAYLFPNCGIRYHFLYIHRT